MKIQETMRNHIYSKCTRIKPMAADGLDKQVRLVFLLWVLVISRFGFERRSCVLIASVPDLGIRFTSVINIK